MINDVQRFANGRAGDINFLRKYLLSSIKIPIYVWQRAVID